MIVPSLSTKALFRLLYLDLAPNLAAFVNQSRRAYRIRIEKLSAQNKSY